MDGPQKERRWEVRKVNDGEYPWAVIDLDGPHGDAFVASNLDKPTARLIAAAPSLLVACRAQHNAIDFLMAKVIIADKSFRPTQSSIWPSIQNTYAVITAAEAR